jgi:hypothetical protein
MTKPTPSGLLFLETGETIFTIFGLIAEAATFVIAFHNYHPDSPVAEVIPVRMHHLPFADTAPD